MSAKNLEGIGPQRLEAPIAFQALEGTFSRRISIILCFCIRLMVVKDLCTRPLAISMVARHFVLGLVDDVAGPAPGQKFRVGLDVADQGVHVGRRITGPGALFLTVATTCLRCGVMI